MITITLSPDELDELIRATEYLYMSYEYGQDEYDRKAIYRYNETIDELKNKLKGALYNEIETH